MINPNDVNAPVAAPKIPVRIPAMSKLSLADAYHPILLTLVVQKRLFRMRNRLFSLVKIYLVLTMRNKGNSNVAINQ